jgi:L-alanine-DL-glutamate epimerase-like enolase superfamily enzyme
MRLHEFAIDLAGPLETPEGELTSRRGTLVGIERPSDADEPDSTPVHGVGEATPLPGWTEDLETCRSLLADYAAAGKDAGEVVADIDPTEHPATRHGVALAVQDAAAREAGDPLAKTLADRDSRVADRVPLAATVGDGTPAESAAAAERAADEGIECLRVEAGTGALDLDLQRVRAVREAVEDGVSIRVDAGGAWTTEAARRAVDVLASLDVACVEQPLSADDLAGLADLRGRGVAVAVDETLASYPVADVLDADAADALVLRPMALGGVDRARDAARLARRTGVGVSVTTTVDAAVARTAAVHLAASIPDLSPCSLATDSRLAEDVVADPLSVVDGEVVVPEGPGIAGDAFDALLW